MKRILLILYVFPFSLMAQLREFTATPMPKPEVQVVQANSTFPEDAVVFVYTTLENLTFRSSMSAIHRQVYNPSSSRYEILCEPIRQIFFVEAKGFIEKSLGILNPQPKEAFYFKVEEGFVERAVGKGFLDVVSSPSGASISLNDIESIYFTPYSREISAGITRLSLRKKYYLNYDTLLRLEPGEHLSINATMKPSWADLTINTKMPPADSIFMKQLIEDPKPAIYINGELKGTGKIAFTGESFGMKPGSYTIRVELENFLPYQEKIVLKASEIKVLNVKLKPVGASLLVRTDPPGTTVTLNDKEVGKTPMQLRVLAGDYVMELRQAGYRSDRQSFRLRENENRVVDIKLLGFTRSLNSMSKIQIASFGVAAVGFGLGAYYSNRANTDYFLYATATTNADQLRKRIEFADKMSPISYVVGGIALVSGIYCSIRKTNFRNKYDVAIVPTRQGGAFSFAYRF